MSGNVEDSTLRSDTSEEKVIGHDHHDHVADIPDPDAGLSDAERKAIVRSPESHFQENRNLTFNFLGSQTYLEA